MSSYILENEQLGWRVQVGYDRPLRYYFLAIAPFDKPLDEVEPEEYIYHNLNEPNPGLSPLDVETILARHGIGMPYDLCWSLMIDGSNGGYPESVQYDADLDWDWGMFHANVHASDADDWKPKGALPDRWYRDFP